MNLPYFAADTLGMSLYAAKAGRLTGSDTHTLTVGPWMVRVWVDVESDVMSGTEMGLWVTVAKNLRCYLVVREKESWLFVLQPDLLKQVGAKTGFAGLTVAERLLEFKPALVRVFRWHEEAWTTYDGAHAMP